jgi:hypothetical protein
MRIYLMKLTGALSNLLKVILVYRPEVVKMVQRWMHQVIDVLFVGTGLDIAPVNQQVCLDFMAVCMVVLCQWLEDLLPDICTHPMIFMVQAPDQVVLVQDQVRCLQEICHMEEEGCIQITIPIEDEAGVAVFLRAGLIAGAHLPDTVDVEILVIVIMTEGIVIGEEGASVEVDHEVAIAGIAAETVTGTEIVEGPAGGVEVLAGVLRATVEVEAWVAVGAEVPVIRRIHRPYLAETEIANQVVVLMGRAQMLPGVIETVVVAAAKVYLDKRGALRLNLTKGKGGKAVAEQEARAGIEIPDRARGVVKEAVEARRALNVTVEAAAFKLNTSSTNT